MAEGLRKEPFFVVGNDRSGTTLFRVMLDSHPQLYIPKESHFISDLMDEFPLSGVLSLEKLTSAFELIRQHKRWKHWGIADELVLKRLDTIGECSLAQFVDLLFLMSMEPTGKRRWGDKTPGYVLEISRLKKLFPNAKFIHLIRDGRDVCLSLFTTGWQGPWVRQIAQRWAETVTTGMQQGENLGHRDYLEVSYEALVLETSETLEKVCGFLGEDYSEKLLSFYEQADNKVAAFEAKNHKKLSRPPSVKDVGRWRTEMSKFHLLIFEAVAGKAMEKAGQRRYFSGLLRPLPAVMNLLFFMADASLPMRSKLGLHFPAFGRKK